jgi:Holliday junction resolvasome RuvABC endonuclease subunit
METNLDQIKEEIKGTNENVEVKSVNILFLDISSSCTGYTIANVNFENKSANFKAAGCLWLPDKWTHQEKYCYMSDAITNYFWVVEKIDYIVVEQYSVNPNKMTGVNVVSEMQGAIKSAAWQNGVKVASILPQTWRSVLKIKGLPKGEDKGKDYKGPTKARVLERLNVPETVVSNITKSDRQTPSDVYDSLAIGMAWLEKLGITKQTYSNIEFNTHVGVVNEQV